MIDPQLLDRLQELWNRPPEPDPDLEVFDPFDATDDDDGEPKPPDWCRRYAHRRAWRSIYGPHWICAVYHPPVRPGVVSKTTELDDDG